MKAFFKKLAYFLRLTDDDNILSITHIACWVVIIKIALAPDPSIADMGGLLVTLAMYYGKKHLNSKKVKLNDAQQEQLAKMQAKVDAVADKVGAVATTLGFSKR